MFFAMRVVARCLGAHVERGLEQFGHRKTLHPDPAGLARHHHRRFLPAIAIAAAPYAARFDPPSSRISDGRRRLDFVID
jgi:hypothetical protein